MKAKFQTFTACGPRRKNEDALAAVKCPQKNRSRYLFVVCDGMGGHSHGEVASQTVIQYLLRHWDFHIEDDIGKVFHSILFVSANFQIYARDNGYTEMGTTLVMASLDGNKMHIAHLGDSRAYLMRPSKGLIYRTKDHTRFTPEGWEVITNAFFTGDPERARPEIEDFEVQPGDRLLLCTDGVYKCISDDALIAHLRLTSDISVIANKLEQWCEQHSHDNYSAILIELT
jgi:protein phosphatase